MLSFKQLFASVSVTVLAVTFGSASLTALAYTNLYTGGAGGGSGNVSLVPTLAQVTTAGNITTNGVTLGAVTTSGSFIPSATNSFDLGNGPRSWRNVSVSGTISVAGGSASVPSVNFGISGSNTGFFSSGSNNVQATVGGTAVTAWTTNTLRGVTNNTTNLGTTSIAFGNVYASGTTIAFRNLGAPGVTSDFVCWSATTGGNLVHQTANCTVSSARFKENIASLSPSDLLAKTMKLRAVSFDMKADGKPSAGFIAEEVARVIPDLVVYTSEYTPEGLAFIKENYPDVIVMNGDVAMIPQTVDYQRLTYVLTGAIQAQQEQLTEEKMARQKLEKRVSRIEKFLSR